MSIYQEHGFKNRADYLYSLTLEYPAAFVYALADILGKGEDFDGLITALEDGNYHFDN